MSILPQDLTPPIPIRGDRDSRKRWGFLLAKAQFRRHVSELRQILGKSTREHGVICVYNKWVLILIDEATSENGQEISIFYDLYFFAY